MSDTLFDPDAFLEPGKKPATPKKRTAKVPPTVTLSRKWVLVGRLKKPPLAHYVRTYVGDGTRATVLTQCGRRGYEVSHGLGPIKYDACPDCLGDVAKGKHLLTDDKQ